METLSLIVLSTLLVSLISFVGVFTLFLKEKLLEKVLFLLVALSVGGLMGGAFLHLLPEAMEEFNDGDILLYVLAGFFLFLVVEKIIHWRHCHEGHCPVHVFAYMNLIGDGIHNFIDGLIIAASFIVSPALGFSSSVAISLHEIPQEIGDFGVLIYGGLSRKKALTFNFISALMAMLGGILGFYFISFSELILKFLLAFAAGGFLYIAASDLIPEIRKETDIRKSLLNFIVIFFGIFLMYLLKFFEG